MPCPGQIVKCAGQAGAHLQPQQWVAGALGQTHKRGSVVGLCRRGWRPLFGLCRPPANRELTACRPLSCPVQALSTAGAQQPAAHGRHKFLIGKPEGAAGAGRRRPQPAETVGQQRGANCYCRGPRAETKLLLPVCQTVFDGRTGPGTGGPLLSWPQAEKRRQQQLWRPSGLNEHRLADGPRKQTVRGHRKPKAVRNTGKADCLVLL